jgi:hypothetical protein
MVVTALGVVREAPADKEIEEPTQSKASSTVIAAVETAALDVRAIKAARAA